jgi:hypothetical protein
VLKDNHPPLPGYKIVALENDLYEVQYSDLHYDISMNYDYLKTSTAPHLISTLNQGGWFDGGAYDGDVYSDYEITLPLEKEQVMGFDILDNVLLRDSYETQWYPIREGYVVDTGNNKLHIYLDTYKTNPDYVIKDEEWHPLKFRVRIK